MKDFDEMTEEEVLEDALSVVPEYLARIRQTGQFDLADCVALELRRIEFLFRHRRNRVRVPNLTIPKLFSKYGEEAKAEQKALNQILAHYKELLTERTIPIRDKYLRGRKVSEINAITAKAIIAGRMQEAGYDDAEITGQRYRARVEVPIGKCNRVRFYVRYKDLTNEERLNEAVSAVGDLKNALERLGYGATVK